MVADPDRLGTGRVLIGSMVVQTHQHAVGARRIEGVWAGGWEPPADGRSPPPTGFARRNGGRVGGVAADPLFRPGDPPLHAIEGGGEGGLPIGRDAAPEGLGDRRCGTHVAGNETGGAKATGGAERLPRDDKTLALRSAANDPTTGLVTLAPRKKVALNQPLRLLAVGPGAPADQALNAPDGDLDGLPGGDFVGRFGTKVRS